MPFEAYLATYARAIAGVRYPHLALLQPAPYATLAQGGAGTAYALWRLGAAPRGWATAALADRRRAAYGVEGQRPADPRSCFLGRAGAQYVRALVAPSTLGAFVRTVRAARGGEIEIMQGTAGLLAASCSLLRRRDDPALRRAAGALADDLLEAVQRRSRRAWRIVDATNFAHRWPGVLHALLTWRDDVPGWLVDSLRRLAAVWRADAIARVDNRASWCTGAAGAALLWCKAFERTGDAGFRRAARKAARAALQAEPPRPHLCCGAGGVAYALLALERVDPGQRWRERAREVGSRALRSTQMTAWPNGLLWGHPGLVCLALDLVAERPLGFPCIEA